VSTPAAVPERQHGTRTRVLVVDDHEIVREGLRMILSEEHETIEIVGEAVDGEEAIRLAERLRPDVVLMDLMMPRLDGIAATERIRATGSTSRVLVLTTNADEERIVDAVRAGAIGYLLKDAMRAELVRAIHAAARGLPTLDPRAQERLMRKVAAPVSASPFAHLTPRELDVLRLVARGHANKQIAAALHLSVGTVKGYVSAILPKIGAGDRTQAALLAVRHGLDMEHAPEP
jgi:two-component system, NarL family, response regulator LiaR